MIAISLLALFVLGASSPAATGAVGIAPAPQSNPAPTLRAPTQPSSVAPPPAATPAGTTSWVELGPKPIVAPADPNYYGTAPFSGRITAIAINASNPSNIFVGGAQGGVWKSIDGGTTWMPLTDNQPSLAVGAIAFSLDYKTLFAGTGEPNHSVDSYSGAGLLKSTDGGKTWSVLGSAIFKGSAISGVLVNANNPSRLLVSTTSGVCCRCFYQDANLSAFGVYLSIDGGGTWNPTIVSRNYLVSFASLVADPSIPNTVYVSSFNGTAWRSTDSGSTWTRLFHLTEPACATSTNCRIALATSAALSGSGFAAAAQSTGNL